jgi:hypothetical protein
VKFDVTLFPARLMGYRRYLGNGQFGPEGESTTIKLGKRRAERQPDESNDRDANEGGEAVEHIHSLLDCVEPDELVDDDNEEDDENNTILNNTMVRQGGWILGNFLGKFVRFEI